MKILFYLLKFFLNILRIQEVLCGAENSNNEPKFSLWAENYVYYNQPYTLIMVSIEKSIYFNLPQNFYFSTSIFMRKAFLPLNIVFENAFIGASLNEQNPNLNSLSYIYVSITENFLAEGQINCFLSKIKWSSPKINIVNNVPQFSFEQNPFPRLKLLQLKEFGSRFSKVYITNQDYHQMWLISKANYLKNVFQRMEFVRNRWLDTIDFSHLSIYMLYFEKKHLYKSLF